MTGPAGPRVVSEVPAADGFPLWRHPEWAERFPWLVQGTTGAGEAEDPFDLGLFGEQPVAAAMERWRRLRRGTGMPVAIHALQVHSAEVRAHLGDLPPGLVALEGFDGHLARRPGLLLTVAVADCVPVSLVDPETRALALLHAGWRGVAGGILERGVAALGEHFSTRPADLWVHCGPAICGRCYEVGPEVHAAVRPDAPPPAQPAPIDLRAALAARARALGADPGRISVSGHCTRCGPGAFFSHRGGSAARQMGVLGRRD